MLTDKQFYTTSEFFNFPEKGTVLRFTTISINETGEVNTELKKKWCQNVKKQ